MLCIFIFLRRTALLMGLIKKLNTVFFQCERLLKVRTTLCVDSQYSFISRLQLFASLPECSQMFSKAALVFTNFTMGIKRCGERDIYLIFLFDYFDWFSSSKTWLFDCKLWVKVLDFTMSKVYWVCYVHLLARVLTLKNLDFESATMSYLFSCPIDNFQFKQNDCWNVAVNSSYLQSGHN